MRTVRYSSRLRGVGVWPGGVCPGGVCLGGVYPGVSVQGVGVSAQGDGVCHTPLWTESQMPVKTLPCRNVDVDGNKVTEVTVITC